MCDFLPLWEGVLDGLHVASLVGTPQPQQPPETTHRQGSSKAWLLTIPLLLPPEVIRYQFKSEVGFIVLLPLCVVLLVVVKLDVEVGVVLVDEGPLVPVRGIGIINIGSQHPP